MKNRNLGYLIAYIILASGMAFAVYTLGHSADNNLYQSQVEACELANVLRKESNDRIDDHQKELVIVRQFLTTAETARRASYARDHRQADLHAANDYARQLQSLESITFGTTPVVDCQQTVKKP